MRGGIIQILLRRRHPAYRLQASAFRVAQNRRFGRDDIGVPIGSVAHVLHRLEGLPHAGVHNREGVVFPRNARAIQHLGHGVELVEARKRAVVTDRSVEQQVRAGRSLRRIAVVRAGGGEIDFRFRGWLEVVGSGDQREMSGEAAADSVGDISSASTYVAP